MAKRFRLDTGCIIDQQENEVLTERMVVNRLNELHEEVEYLKPLANENSKYIDDMEDDIITFKQKAEKLQKENEQLKQRIKELEE